MPPATPTDVPSVLVAKDTWEWNQSLDYSSQDGYTLSFAFNGAGQLKSDAAGVTITPVANGSWDISISSTATALAPGKYDLALFVTKAGKRITADLIKGITVQPDFFTVTPGSLQSQAEKNLAAVDAVIAGRITADLQNYQILGRAVTKIPIKELMQLRGQLRNEVWRERHPGQFGIPIRARFTGVE